MSRGKTPVLGYFGFACSRDRRAGVQMWVKNGERYIPATVVGGVIRMKSSDSRYPSGGFRVDEVWSNVFEGRSLKPCQPS